MKKEKYRKIIVALLMCFVANIALAQNNVGIIRFPKNTKITTTGHFVTVCTDSLIKIKGYCVRQEKAVYTNAKTQNNSNGPSTRGFTIYHLPGEDTLNYRDYIYFDNIYIMYQGEKSILVMPFLSNFEQLDLGLIKIYETYLAIVRDSNQNIYQAE
ncbi:MAG: hypothetical protein KBB86_00235 [Candidatus Pacebacteria bacterium]|nr:hypothetical protein [Candidatus Paceibacterota bacterium]